MRNVIHASESLTDRHLRFAAVLASLATVIALLVSRTAREQAVDLADRVSPPKLRIAPETSWVSIGDYDPFEPTRYEQLPQSVQTIVDSLLVTHVGIEYRERLRFVHGQVVDHSDSTARAFTRRAQWPVFSYRLGFELPRPVEGVEAYIGYVTLYPSHGRASLVEFPPVRARPELGQLVPLRIAGDTAARHGLIAVRAALEYSVKDSLFYYVLTGRYRDRGMTGTEEAVLVNAHTGRFMRKGTNRWIE